MKPILSPDMQDAVAVGRRRLALGRRLETMPEPLRQVDAPVFAWARLRNGIARMRRMRAVSPEDARIMARAAHSLAYVYFDSHNPTLYVSGTACAVFALALYRSGDAPDARRLTALAGSVL